MAASISSVTTMGYGNGTFNGSIALVVTLGYGIGAAVVLPAYETQRHILYGTSLERHTLHSTSLERHTLSGSTP
jgi:hypothetical protein